MTADEKYMREAIKQAKKAYAIGEVPIGCVIVYQEDVYKRQRLGFYVHIKKFYILHHSIMLCEKFRCSRVGITLTNFLEQHDI